MAEPLPGRDNRQSILLYESAEGGAGVLTRLATEPTALARVAEEALRIMHFKRPSDGVWRHEGLEQELDENGNPPKDTQVDPDSPAYSVGRDNLHNPAPGLRLAQTFGDQAFNNNTDINKALNGSPLGTAYHDTFGTRGTFVQVDTNDDKVPDTTKYVVGSGKEGSFKGILNTSPADQLGNVLPVRECNIKRDPASGAPVFGVRSCT